MVPLPSLGSAGAFPPAPVTDAPLLLSCVPNFDNTFVARLPADPSISRAPHAVLGACFSRVQPVPVAAPRLIAHAAEVASLLGLLEEDCQSQTFLQVCAGNALLPGMDPYAACYGGHQFGSWAGQLGDGRAITLAEILNDRGERWELQLKGAGPTPYSRMADGRAVLRSSLREFLCSEAMHHLGVPTTRALSLVVTADQVVRDMLYDGHPRAEPGALVARVAPSFVRFGNFELLAAREDETVLRQLTDYTIQTHFPELWPQAGATRPAAGSPETYAAFFKEVCRRTGVLMAHWMRVGFVHGVMNTDNMSILGLTIDYGPFGFLDHFAPDFTPNTTDAGQGRYRFANQPRIARWNLLKLAEALYPLVQAPAPLQDGLAAYARAYESEETRMLAEKLGLGALNSSDGPDGDQALVNEMFAVLAAVETDMTLFFRGLADVPTALGPDAPAAALLAPLAASLYDPDALPAAVRERT
ncbi:MAG: protein adenylyltransferase SelO, partial [Myxococcales bacterium]